ncbi:neuronal acetylcholine receptor subunit alpha-6-like [Diadema antillarum]|uniref:neuronal acetylcholine receptor subunit alpha-6-like n=1 Tax=Diadema antillarum TaxID=105358 RepID=UPI003A86FCF9
MMSLCAVAIGLALLSGATCQDHKRLMDDLFGNYDKDLIPHFDKVHNVSFSPTLRAIADVELFKGRIEIDVWETLMWSDSRLVWNPEDYSNVDVLRIPISSLWKPDVVLYNSVETTQSVTDILATVYADGTIHYIQPHNIKAQCAMDVSRYPYDEQTCELIWGSWAHHTENIALIVDKLAGFDEILDNKNWDVIDYKLELNRKKYPCCAESYDQIKGTVVIARKNSSSLIGPAVITAWLILVVFILRPEGSGERVIFGGIVFIALVVQAMALSSEVPAYMTTRLGRYLLASMVLTAIITLINAVLFSFYRRDSPLPSKDIQEAPANQDRRRFFLIINLGLLFISTILLAIITGALFS